MEMQIEEIARDICGFSRGQTCIIDNKKCDMACTYARVAEKITAKDYRKASSVAEEIIDRIDELFMYCEKYSGHIIKIRIAELKKKYTGEKHHCYDCKHYANKSACESCIDASRWEKEDTE